MSISNGKVKPTPQKAGETKRQSFGKFGGAVLEAMLDLFIIFFLYLTVVSSEKKSGDNREELETTQKI